MNRRRQLIILLAISFIITLSIGGRADGDNPAGPDSLLPSRVPLLDESGLEKFGKPQAAEPPGVNVDKEFPTDTHIPLSTRNLRYFSYFTKVRLRIDQSHYYPKEAAKDFLNGIVTVLIEIQRDGKVEEVEVVESSGQETLDDAAINIVRKAAPFPIIPSRIHNVPLKVTANIRFVPTQEAVQRQEGLGLTLPFK